MSESHFPRPRREGKGAGGHGLPGQGQGTREGARLRAQNRTLADIAQTLGVSKSSVSLWVRDVPFTPTLRLRGPHRHPHPAHEAKLRQIEELNREGQSATWRTDRRGVLRRRRRSLRGRGFEDGRRSSVLEQRSGDGEAVLRLVPSVLRRRRDAYAWTPISPPRTRPQRGRSVLVVASRTSRPLSSTSPTARFRIRASVETSTSTVASLSATHVRERIAKSWVL